MVRRLNAAVSVGFILGPTDSPCTDRISMATGCSLILKEELVRLPVLSDQGQGLIRMAASSLPAHFQTWQQTFIEKPKGHTGLLADFNAVLVPSQTGEYKRLLRVAWIPGGLPCRPHGLAGQSRAGTPRCSTRSPSPTASIFEKIDSLISNAGSPS
jgi:hypothetical protein